MSSNDILPSVIKILSQYLLSSIVIIGNISCILSLIVFLQKSMRKNSSGLYFLSFTFCNIIFINIIILCTVLYFGFNIDPTRNIFILCQIEYYTGFAISTLSSSFLVFASIDRFIITSSNFHIHRFSTHSMAIKFILILTIFWCIMHIHVFFFTVEQRETTNIFSCTFQNGTYTLILFLYEFLTLCLLTPTLMIIFGLRTIINVRRLYSIDRQLILMMLSQCFIYILFRLPLPIYFIYDYITRAAVQDNRCRIINMFFFYIPYCSFFFVNLLSHSFRVEFKRLTKNLIRRYIPNNHQQIRKLKKHRHNRVYPMKIIQRKVSIEMTL
jgi:hypothetical protein